MNNQKVVELAAKSGLDAEPVAYIGTDGSLGWLKKPDVLYSKAVPLFAHPAPAVVRQLLEALEMTLPAIEFLEQHFPRSKEAGTVDLVGVVKEALDAAKENGL